MLAGPGRSSCPAAVWLALFFLVPLVFIAAVSLGTHDSFGRVVLDRLSLDNYRKAFDPVFLPTISRSLRYAALTTIAVAAHRLSDRVTGSAATAGATRRSC